MLNYVSKKADDLLESQFAIEELFFSRTNKQGQIQAGNSVFVRVSEFDKEQLIGKAHNTIRHADMPKSVFKLFWSEISQDHVFCSYVKNKSKTGKFYWVLAVVFPVSQGYISVRLKPTSPLLETIKNIYSSMLEIEDKKGLEASTAHLIKSLKDLGFENYNEFMQHALQIELFQRDEKISQLKKSNKSRSKKNTSSLERVFAEVDQSLEKMIADFREISHRSHEFEKLKENCNAGTESVKLKFSRLEYLSVNMSIAAHKLGKDGGTLGVVAGTFQSTADLVVKNFDNFNLISAEVLQDYKKAQFNILSSRSLIEMLHFQINEVLQDITSGRLDRTADQKMALNEVKILTSEVLNLIQKNVEFQNSFLDKLERLEKNALSTKIFVTRLDLIRTGGKLEGSRTNQVSELFLPFINEMESFVKAVSLPINQITHSVHFSSGSFSEFVQYIKKIEHTLADMDLQLEMANKYLKEQVA